MQLTGTKSFPTNPEVTYQIITDPEKIKKAMPGLKELVATSETFYEAKMEVGVAGIKGSYEGTLEMKDVSPPNHYRLIVQGEGSMGFMEADVLVNLAESGSGTDVTYSGDAKVGGTVAGVGQRVLSGVAKLIINQFFNALVKEAKTVANES